MKEQIRKWFYNHSHSIRKSLGEIKRRKPTDKECNQEQGDNTDVDDDEAMKAHCDLIQKECRKRDGPKDYDNVF